MILRSIPILLLVQLLFCSCKTEKEDLELDVINATLLELVGTDYYLMPFPIPPYSPLHPDSVEVLDEMLAVEGEDTVDDSIGNLEYKSKLLEEYNSFDWEAYRKDSLTYEQYIRNRPVDTANLVILVHDSLIDYPKRGVLESILSEVGFEDNFNVDTSWRSLAILLVDSMNMSIPLPISKITKTGRYNLQYEKAYQPTNKDRLIGYVKFSRVALNQQKDKACFVYEFTCGRLCGYGTMVFAQKVNNQWKIVGQRELWVS